MSHLEPLRFHPILKTVIWGGNKICNFKNIAQQEDNIGESWEISAVPGYESIVSQGYHKGKSIIQLIDELGADLLGTRVYEKYHGKFPLLIKFIDANDNLSVQVHPNDSLAMERHGCAGKTEMWYIVQADTGAKIYSGLTREITPEDYVRMVEEGTFHTLLASYASHRGDVYFLPAGRVHAIGAGNLLAEIQESSDITYRIYDYNRIGPDGKPRQLHTDMAKDAIDYNVVKNYRSSRPDDKDEDSLLAKCEHFTTRRLKIKGSKSLTPDGESFIILMGIEGNLVIEHDKGNMELNAGNTVLIPALNHPIKLKGEGTILKIHSS